MQRPWRDFFGSLSPPKLNWPIYERRVVANVVYYRANYTVLAALAVAPTLARAPRLFVVLCALASAWIYATAVRRQPFRIGKRYLNLAQTYALLVVVSLVSLALARMLTSLAYIAAISTSIVLAHASLRTVTVKSQFQRLGVGLGSTTPVARATASASKHQRTSHIKFGWEGEGDVAAPASRSLDTLKKAVGGDAYRWDAEDPHGSDGGADRVFAPADRAWGSSAPITTTTTQRRTPSASDGTPRAAWGTAAGDTMAGALVAEYTARAEPERGSDSGGTPLR